MDETTNPAILVEEIERLRAIEDSLRGLLLAHHANPRTQAQQVLAGGWQSACTTCSSLTWPRATRDIPLLVSP